MKMNAASRGLLFFALVIVLSVNLPHAWGQPQITEADHVEEFGSTEGTNVNSGFLLLDGRYMPLPYKVTRRGLSVFINDLRVDGPVIKWPISEDWKGKPFAPPLDRDSVLKEAESRRRSIERQLENDFCVILFPDLSQLVFRPAVTVSVMRVLQNEESSEQKVIALEQMELGHDRTRDQLKALVDKFTPSQELAKRLDTLAKSSATYRVEQECRIKQRNSQSTNAPYSSPAVGSKR
jgi:hypothetical protein